MRTAVEINRAVGVRAADVEDEDPLKLRQLDDLHTVRGQQLARGARGLAARMRFEPVPHTLAGEYTCPGLERDRPGIDEDRGAAFPRKPDTLDAGRCAEEHPAIRAAGGRTGGAAGRGTDPADGSGGARSTRPGAAAAPVRGGLLLGRGARRWRRSLLCRCGERYDEHQDAGDSWRWQVSHGRE